MKSSSSSRSNVKTIQKLSGVGATALWTRPGASQAKGKRNEGEKERNEVNAGHKCSDFKPHTTTVTQHASTIIERIFGSIFQHLEQHLRSRNRNIEFWRERAHKEKR